MKEAFDFNILDIRNAKIVTFINFASVEFDYPNIKEGTR
jgi:hypothetical protein